MRALPARDRRLLAILIPLWLGCLFLHVKQGLSGRLAWPGVQVAAAASTNELPEVVGFRGGFDGEASGLRVGDRIMRIGTIDARGLRPMMFVPYAMAQADAERRVRIAFLREQLPREATLVLKPFPSPWWRMIPFAASWAAVGLLILWRAARIHSARTMAYGAIGGSFTYSYFYGGSVLLTQIWMVQLALVCTIVPPLLQHAIQCFPDRRPTGTWQRAWPWVYSLPYCASVMSFLFGFPFSFKAGLIAFPFWLAAGVVTALLSLQRNYQDATPSGRRQLKWVIFGLIAPFVPLALARAIAIEEPSLDWLNHAAVATTAAFPICFLVGMVRDSLFDIDRIITAAASYSALLIALLASALWLGPLAARAVGGAVAADPTQVQIWVSVVLAAILVPADRRLRPQLERLFFAERYALERSMQTLLEELAQCAHPTELLQRAGERLNGLLLPDCCAIYARSSETYTSVFGRGRALPPAIEISHPFATILAVSRAPFAVPAVVTAGGGGLTQTEASFLAGIGATVVAPIGRGSPLAAFLCLGAKRSGDAYSPTDLALLAAVADKISTELLNAEIRSLSDELAQANHDLQASLKETKAAQTELITAARMASLGQLTAGVAHEMNSPIAAVSRAIEHAEARVRQLLQASQPPIAHKAVEIGFQSDAISTAQGRAARRRLEARFAGNELAGHHLAALSQIAAVGDIGEALVDAIVEQNDGPGTAAAIAAFELGTSLRVIQVGADKLAAVVRGLRAYSRVDEETVTLTDLRTSVEESLIVHQHEMRHGIEVVRRFDEVAPIPARPAELNQVWSNLIRNAVQAMNGHGQLTITIREQAGGVQVQIADTGSGIPPDHLTHIFEPHFSTKRGTEFGLGLGLAIVRSIVDRHRGSIEVHSEPGATTFQVWLPREV